MSNMRLADAKLQVSYAHLNNLKVGLFENPSLTGDKPDMSPPRERKPMPTGTGDRKYSWATVQIVELRKELDAALARNKVG